MVMPCGRTVSENVTLPTPEVVARLACTCAAPVTEPAVTVIWARPLLSVFTLVADRDREPLTTENCTGTFAATPRFEFTWTTRGCSNLVFTVADWLLPEMI